MFCSELFKATQQLHYYQKILQRDDIKRKLHDEGFTYCEPELHLVIGRRPQIDIDNYRLLKKQFSNNVKIQTYDELLERLIENLDQYRFGQSVDFEWG